MTSAPLVGLATLATAGTTSPWTITVAFVGVLGMVIAAREAIVRTIRHRRRTSARGPALDGAGQDGA